MSETVKKRLSRGGRIVIPAEMRKRLGMEIGDNVNIEIRGESLYVTTSGSALQRLQGRFKKNVPHGLSLVDELIAERRAEAMKE